MNRVEVPDAKTIQVFLPLNVEGGTSTRVVDSRYYKVESSGLPSASPSRPETDSVAIISITPDTHVPLRVGESATIGVEVEYNLISAESGRVTLVIQQGESGRASLGSVTEVVQKGKARLVLSKYIQGPDTKALQIFIPRYAEGGGGDNRPVALLPAAELWSNQSRGQHRQVRCEVVLLRKPTVHVAGDSRGERPDRGTSTSE